MSTEVLTQVLAANVKATFGAGSMFLLTTATGPVNINAYQIGSGSRIRRFTGVPAGFKFTADDPGDGFNSLEVTSPSNQTIQIAIGDDDVSFSNNVSVTGTVTTVASPAATAVDNAPLVTAAGQHALIAANGARRRITLTNDPTVAGAYTVYLRAAAGIHDLLPLQPGVSLEIDSVAAFDYRDPGAGGINSILILEEQ